MQHFVHAVKIEKGIRTGFIGKSDNAIGEFYLICGI